MKRFELGIRSGKHDNGNSHCELLACAVSAPPRTATLHSKLSRPNPAKCSRSANLKHNYIDPDPQAVGIDLTPRAFTLAELPMRTIHRRYEDPLEALWITTAERIGIKVVRGGDAYATTNGAGVLSLASNEHLDADDCIAQMVLHEICHSLVAGHEGFSRPDWGLENDGARDLDLEFACLRAQAWLLDRHGLRRVFAPTTDYRAFYDSLGSDPLLGPDSRDVVRGKIAVARSHRDPWAPHLALALVQTELLVRAAAPLAGPDSLLRDVEPPQKRHRNGKALSSADSKCGSCVWFGTRGKCNASRVRVAYDEHACEAWEQATHVECVACGACCREAYGAVLVSKRDAQTVAKRNPKLVVLRDEKYELERVEEAGGTRCAALVVKSTDPRYTCEVYEDRPKTCRDFTLRSSNCYDARVRVGLSRA